MVYGAELRYSNEFPCVTIPPILCVVTTVIQAIPGCQVKKIKGSNKF